MAILRLADAVARKRVAGTGAAVLWTLGGIGIPFLLGILIQVVQHPQTRRQWIGFGRILLREPESRDFTAARRAAGAEGKVLQLDGATLWTDAEIVPVLLDSAAPLAQRLRAIRCMASAGHTWRSDLLAGLSKADADPLRAEAQRALENLAGEATQVNAAPA